MSYVLQIFTIHNVRLHDVNTLPGTMTTATVFLPLFTEVLLENQLRKYTCRGRVQNVVHFVQNIMC